MGKKMPPLLQQLTGGNCLSEALNESNAIVASMMICCKQFSLKSAFTWSSLCDDDSLVIIYL